MSLNRLITTNSPCELPRHCCWEGEPYEMAFRLIPAGRFRMGSRGFSKEEEPRHWVKIESPFWIAETPVTELQHLFIVWRFSRKTQRKEFNPANLVNDERKPRGNVTWYDVRANAEAMRKVNLEFPDGAMLFRLPTEAEWEYACRAGTTTEYHSGDGEAALDVAGWSGPIPHPVKEKEPNAFGLYDMHGNILEWCQDRWCDNSYRNRGASWVDQCEDEDEHCGRVLRGCAWWETPFDCRSAYRVGRNSADRFWGHGYRLCVSSGPGQLCGRKASKAERVEGGGADDWTTGVGTDHWEGITPPRSGRELFDKP